MPSKFNGERKKDQRLPTVRVRAGLLLLVFAAVPDS
jgi:hypothetical protein